MITDVICDQAVITNFFFTGIGPYHSKVRVDIVDLTKINVMHHK